MKLHPYNASMRDCSADVHVKAFGDFTYADIFECVVCWVPVDHSELNALSLCMPRHAPLYGTKQ